MTMPPRHPDPRPVGRARAALFLLALALVGSSRAAPQATAGDAGDAEESGEGRDPGDGSDGIDGGADPGDVASPEAHAPEEPPTPVRRAGDLVARGDLSGALAEALAALETGAAGDPEDGLRARFVVGYARARTGEPEAAAPFLEEVAASRSPLAAHASWLLAQEDFRAGRHGEAIRRCTAYRKEWRSAPFALQCELLIAEALAESGKADEAVAAYRAFQTAHPDEGEEERIAYGMGRAWEVAGRTDRAVQAYAALVDRHLYHTTRLAAEEGLERLRAKGIPLPEGTDADLFARARTARTCCGADESQELYEDLLARYEGRPDDAFGNELRDARRGFLWRNRRYVQLAEDALARFEAAKTRDRKGAATELRWAIRAFTKEGAWSDALKWAERARTEYGDQPIFEEIDELLALLYMSAGRYVDARRSWQTWGDGKASRKEDARWFAAWCTYRAGELEAAREAFTALVDEGHPTATAALYFRARVHDRLGAPSQAAADRDEVLARSPDGYYGVLVRGAARLARGDVDHRLARVGRWPGAEEAAPTAEAAADPSPAQAGIASDTAGCSRGIREHRGPPSVPPAADHGTPGRSVFASPPGGRDRPVLATLLPLAEAAEGGVAPPSPGPVPDPARGAKAARKAYDVPVLPSTSAWHDAAAGRAMLDDLAARWWDVWPALPLARELAAVGLRNEAATIVRQARDDARAAAKSRTRKSARRATAGPASPWKPPAEGFRDPPPLADAPRRARLLGMEASTADWRNLAVYLGDARGMVDTMVSPSRLVGIDRADAVGGAPWRIAYPPAFAADVWPMAHEAGVDPLLVLGLMRQESTYNPRAKSRAGAMGLMQIMPVTGGRIAALTRFAPYDVDRLWEPAVNVRFGVWYLGQLLRRFDGNFPLAVASYNGGPHNVGRWLVGRAGMPVDEFVEEIAFPETRNYVKRVVGHYQMYVSIYAPGEYVQVPASTEPDHPEVIDF